MLLLGLGAGAAVASPGPGDGRRSTTSPAVSRSIGAQAAAIAMRYLGVKYVWGGATPKGFDCSGLVMYVYAQLGVQLPHYTGDVVKISKLSEANYTKNYVGAVRPYGLGPPIVYPVVGSSRYSDTFATTPKGILPGNDIVAARKSLVVAAEAGTVKTTSKFKPAGCMLYLYGKSGTTYEYLHLNNDLTNRNDNGGKCEAGTAYAPGLVNGQKVRAGQLLGFVGDSGVANGTQPHMHFEVHRAGRPLNPYPFLNRAQRPLFAILPGTSFTLALEGKVVSKTLTTLTFSVKSLRAWPGGFKLTNIKRTVTVKVPDTASIELSGPDLASRNITTLASAVTGQGVSVRTTPAPPTLQALLGKSGALQANEIILAAIQ